MSFESPTLYKYFNRMAKELEIMGDSVGPNDMELSNLLWLASGKMHRYSKQFLKEEA